MTLGGFIHFKPHIHPKIGCANWRFLFHAMQKMGINEMLIFWVKLFSGNASTTTKFDGSPRKKEKEKEKLKEGLDMAAHLLHTSFLFLLF